MSLEKIAAVFPGQGSQFPGMSKPLLDDFPWTKQVYEEAADAVGEDLLKLSAEGPADILQLTMNQQPCILVTSYAWYQVLRRELDFQPAAAAGHSLGEYTALLAAKALTLVEAVKLVRRRGEMMQEAVPVGTGKMAAVLGLEDALVEKLCETATEGKESEVVAANYNAPLQVVIAGHATAVDRAIALATQDGEFKARKVVPLNVSAPFHSPLMTPVAEGFSKYLAQVNWQPLNFPIAFNVDGTLRGEGEIAPLMQKQIDHPVCWTQCVQSLEGAGSGAFLEPGPGKVLSGLIKRITKKVKPVSVESLEGLRAFEKLVKEAK